MAGSSSGAPEKMLSERRFLCHTAWKEGVPCGGDSAALGGLPRVPRRASVTPEAPSGVLLLAAVRCKC